MKYKFIINTISCVILSLFILSCQQTKEESIPEISADTRKWVKAAYDSVDVMLVGAPFNDKKVVILKEQAALENDPFKKLELSLKYAMELLRAGQTNEALQEFNASLDYININKIEASRESLKGIYSTMAIAYMRLGEVQNCVQNHNHQSCLIPITDAGIHQLPFGSQSAIKMYEGILKEFPDDLESKFLLNIAYMTLGQYPGKVPREFRIDPSWFKSKISIQPFKDIAPELGINRKGHAGGVVVDDFTNDGWLDIVVTSWIPDESLVFYVNNGDGSFTDKTIEFGLQGQVGILNLNQTDFNNDGWLDLYLMRGAWLMTEGDIPNTLLMNTGKGSFRDVTLKAGLVKHAPGQTAAWSDFNLDGYVDLVIPNESLPDHLRGIDLYINQQDGTFKHSSAEFGLDLNYYFKGCVATDVNNDRYPDIFFSSLYNGCFLFINENGIKFNMAYPGVNPDKPQQSFPCWNFDYDNDGDEDLFVSAYKLEDTPADNWMKCHMGQIDTMKLPRLYNNKGNIVFEEVGMDIGLTEVAYTMGCNFGDINTDGFLDFYLGTGNPTYQSIVPNKMYLNMEGKRFEDVSYSGGFANIQKGHGVGFGDLDHDGDEDLYVVIGGAYTGDFFYNALFENPNEHKNNWLVLKLTGQSANKSAIGARVAISIQENGKERKIYRTVTSGASFGGNSLALEIGLRKASSINNVSVQWPCKECPDQIYTGMTLNKAYHLIQGEINPTLLDYMPVAFKAKSEHSAHHH